MQTDTQIDSNPESNAIPLTQLSRGQSARVLRTQADADDCSMLRAMGLRPEVSIQMCRLGEPCIVSLMGDCGGGCRIGLAKDIASRVMVEVDAASAE